MFIRRDKTSILILNKPYVLGDLLCRNIFKVPEILNRLRQYREVLYKNGVNVPVWVYCITQDIRTLKEPAQMEVVYFLVSLGLWDRLLSREGWPNYLLSAKTIASVIEDENLFQEQSLILAKNARLPIDTDPYILQKAQSFYNSKTESFQLTKLKQSNQFLTLKEGVIALVNQKSEHNKVYQFLAPHNSQTLDELLSINIEPRDFLQGDQDLKWLWPDWRRAQIKNLDDNDLEVLLN